MLGGHGGARLHDEVVAEHPHVERVLAGRPGEIGIRCSRSETNVQIDWGQKMDFSAPVIWQFDTEEPYAAVMQQQGKNASVMTVEQSRRVLERLQDASVLVLQGTSAPGEPVTHVFRLLLGESENRLAWLRSYC